MNQTLQQLESARNLALGDGRYYPTIIPGVLPIIGANANASRDIRRWGAEFLSETFASPTWPPDAKENMAMTVLATLKEYLETAEDRSVIKNTIQAAASIYPLVYRHIISDPNDTQNWQLMQAIKSNILRRMDVAPPGVRMCSLKFVQQVVLVQTPGPIDPRRPDHSDISLAIAPRDHPLVPHTSMEAEGHALLDKLLDIIHGDHSDGLLVTATLNSLALILQRRPAVANKILSSILNSNPLKLANSPMTPKNKVIMRSIERTTRALLINIMKRNPEHPNNGRIQQYLERVHRMRNDVFDEANRKRPAPTEPTDGLDSTKRQRLVPDTPASTPPVPDLPPGPVSYRQLFTLNPDANTANFDVQAFKDPEQLLRILVPILQSIDGTKMDQAINIVRARFLTFSQATSQTSPATSPAIDDEPEYEPEFEPEDPEQMANRLDSLSDAAVHTTPAAPAAPLAPFKLPEAPPLTDQEVHKYGDLTVRRAFGMLGSIDENSKSKGAKAGFNRLAASDYGRDAWITILSRLATRASVGLEDPNEGIKDEYAVKNFKGSFSICDSIRDGLYQYVMYDWKRRMDVAVSWLNEEWYNDAIRTQSSKLLAKISSETSALDSSKNNYQRSTLRFFDGIIPFIEHNDKILIRFLSELPALDLAILSRLKKMAEDPERIDLAVNCLQYLYMFRPPIRQAAVQTLEELWRENDRAKPSARKLLQRWKPEVLETEQDVTMGEGGMVKIEGGNQLGQEGANGALEVKAAS